MGRSAKRKKIRQTAKETGQLSDTSANRNQPTHFVRQLERQGYHLKQIERSPELPEQKVDPQV